MPTRTLAFSVMLLLAAHLPAQDAAKAKEVRAEIAKLEARLAELKAQLAKLEPGPIRLVRLRPPELAVGHAGTWEATPGRYYQFRIREILDPTTMIVQGGVAPPVIVTGFPTRDRAEEQTLELRGNWKVSGTRRHFGKTYLVAEPIK